MARAIICLIGLDGSGKTSQLMLIKDKLQRKGVCCRYVHLHVAVFRLVSLPLLFLCKKIGYREEAHHPVVGSNKAIKSVWPFFFFIDFLIFFVGMTLPYFLRRGIVFLFDRYIYDALVDLMAAMNDPDVYKTLASKLLMLLPKPTTTVLLDLDEQVAFVRMSRKGEAHTLDYLRRRRHLFLRLASKLTLPVVDASKPFDEVHNRIIEAIHNQ